MLRRILFSLSIAALAFGSGTRDITIVRGVYPPPASARPAVRGMRSAVKYHSRTNWSFRARMLRDAQLDKVDTLRVLALRAEFQTDSSPLTTGNGKMDLKGFLNDSFGLAYDPPHTRVYFEKLMEGLHNFYLHNSVGKFVIVSRVFPEGLTDAYQLPHNMLYYGDTTSGLGVENGLTRLMRDAIYAAGDDTSLHFSDYDQIVIFHAGSTIQADPNRVHSFDLWTGTLNEGALQAYLGVPYILADHGHTRVTAASILPEMARNDTIYQGQLNISGMSDIEGTVYHEFNHLLGGLDLYDVTGQSQGVGCWSLMGSGNWLGDWNLNVPPGAMPSMLDPWHRVLYGWVKPLVVNMPRESIPIFAAEMETTDFARRGDSLHPLVVKVPISPTEYFLIENRQTEVRHPDTLTVHVEEGVPVSVADGEYDFFQPGSGILIWHIDENVINQFGPLNEINIDPTHMGVKLVEGCAAQNFDAIEYQDYLEIYGSKYDPFFIGGYDDSLNDHTNPTSDGYYGKSFISIAALAGLDSIHLSDTFMPVGVNYELSRPGFPQNPGWQMPFNAASCVDLNQDGHDAYVVSDTGGDIFAWKNDGTTFLTGHTNGLFARLPTSTHAAVTVDDIQGDNHLEVVCAADNGKLYAYTSSGTPVPGFPVTTLDRITATPVLCDLDHDGKKEIIVGSTDGNLYVWRGNGKSYPGFPVQLGSEIRAAVALTDLQQPRIAVLGSDGRLFLVNPDGTIAPGFPVNLNVGSLYTYAAPVVGDVDHNGQREIVCVVSGGYNYKTVTVGLDGKVRYQSQSLIENPFYGTPLLAGLNPDGELETVLAAYHSIYAFNGNDAQVSNYPFSQDSVFYFIKAETLSEGIYLFNFTSDFIYSSSPVMADVDGSGTPSIVIGSPQWGVLAFNARTGKSLNWSPLTTIGSVSATPLICDADHDGKLEVAVGSDDGTFHVWKLPGNPNSIIWGSFLKDPDHTGLYTDTVSSGSLASAPKVLGKFYVYPNPAQKHATARYALGAVTNAKAQIKLLDVSGQSLVDMAGTAYPSTDNELEFSTLSVPTGVYIVRLEVNSDQGRVVKFYKLGVSR